jgi:hypothetical protein
MLDMSRDPLAIRLFIIQTTLMAILYSLIFYRLELNQEGIQNMNGVLFLCIVNSSFGTVFAVINVSQDNRPQSYINKNFIIIFLSF